MTGLVAGIDASNIREGGGLKHIFEILINASPEEYGFSKVIVWAPASLLGMYPSKDWLEVRGVEWFEKSLVHRFLWRLIYLKKALNKECDVAFFPGGIGLKTGCPEVAMSQNMQPFIESERKAVGFGKPRLRLELLRFLQGRSFQRADASLFLTNFARDVINEQYPFNVNNAEVIPHGIDAAFFGNINNLGERWPVELLYVSTLNVYKHQKEVIDAVSLLLEEGLDVRMTFVGGKVEGYGDDVLEKISTVNKLHQKEVVKYIGKVGFDSLPKIYSEADIFVFASSCENLPNILLEAMAAGLPIVSSNYEPMPSVLGDAGLYCDVSCAISIANGIKQYISKEGLRKEMSAKAQDMARAYSWKLASNRTFELLSKFSKRS